MARKIKNLSVKTREYKDRDGNSKANWQNIGVIMENDQGKQFMLIDRWVNLAGLPDFGNKPNPSAVIVTINDADNDYQPGKPTPNTPTYKGNDDLQSFQKIPTDEIPF